MNKNISFQVQLSEAKIDSYLLTKNTETNGNSFIKPIYHKRSDTMKEEYNNNQSEIKNSDWLEPHDLGEHRFNFGFWEGMKSIDNDGKWIIEIRGVSSTRFFETLSSYGYYKRYRESGSYIFLYVENNLLQRVYPAQMKDFAIHLIKQLPDQVSVYGKNFSKELLYEIFLKQQHVLFGESMLSPFNNHTTPILTDTQDVMYFPFRNCVVKVTCNQIELLNYSDLEGQCVWKEHIIQRDFILSNEEPMFHLFIQNVCNNDPCRIEVMRCAIGYSLHRYYSETNTKAVILYDEQITDIDSANGGTGKGVFANSLSKLRKMETLDGQKFEPREKFNFQRISESTQLVFIDDIRQDFDFDRFKSVLTNGWEVEAKHKATVRIPLEDSPKMLIASNSIMKCKDGYTAERRQYILEFSDYYSKLKNITSTPIIHEHGCEFFSGWDNREWSHFDNYMMNSCMIYLTKGLPNNKSINVAFNKLLQSTSNDFIEWVQTKNFISSKQYNFNDHYQDFKNQQLGEDVLFSKPVFRRWLMLYATSINKKYHRIKYNDKTYFKIS